MQSQGFSKGKFRAGNGPCFSQIETEIPKFYKKFPNDFLLHFGENFVKIAPKITKLQVI